MSRLHYSPLTRDELDLLLAPGAEDVADAWDRFTGGLHALLQLKTRTYPRPLVPEAHARESIPEAMRALSGTPFYEKAFRNAHAVEEIERGFRDGEGRPELYQAVDEFLEAMLDEWNAIRYYPDPPPVLTSSAESNPIYERWYASGGR